MGKKRMGEEGNWELGVGSWGRRGIEVNTDLFPTQHTATRRLKQQHFPLSTPFPTRNSELGTHSALSTLHSALREALNL
uniref:Uncharacterized protein n=1 Tax=Desertifilum tharense IPPAS B-1220 TaxID=1781255 RepID=A0ACD5GZN2_9CYAN